MTLPVSRFWLKHFVALFGLCLAAAASAQDFTAKSIQVDPTFPYYQDRSPESIAAELKANGYGWVRYIVTRDSAANGKFVDACRKAGLTVSYTTLGNGVYDTGDLPAGWKSWGMKFKDPKATVTGYTYLCLNHDDYRRWKKERIIATLQRMSFDAFEMMESFWPAYNGPSNSTYGCLCDHCRAAFQRLYPGESAIPEFMDAKSTNYYRTNRKLYKTWIEFRARSVASFLDDIVNGPGGVREKFPKLKVGVWGIADDIPKAVGELKEWEGIDGALLVKTVRPDFYVIQTDWPDWTKPELAPEYVRGYKPFVDAIRATGSKISIHVQADIGSHEKCRRGSDWMAKCEAAAREAGMSGVTAYEYHLSLDIYEVPPKPRSASGVSNTVTIIFNKRLNATNAVELANYEAGSGKVISAKLDGNLVKLQVTGRPTTVIVRNLTDDPARRFFTKHPLTVMPKPANVQVRWAKGD
jgi:hypothetical protein